MYSTYVLLCIDTKRNRKKFYIGTTEDIDARELQHKYKNVKTTKSFDKIGLVYFAASQDYDALLFGAPQLIRNLTLSQKRRLPGSKIVFTFLELLELKEVLKELKINHEQLIALGILTGTDFNIGGVKGYGPKKALKLVQDYKNEKDFDKMFKELNVDFDWKEVYDVFVDLPVDKKVKLKWDKVDDDKVREVLVEKHDFNLERVSNALAKYKEENKNANQKGLGEFFS